MADGAGPRRGPGTVPPDGAAFPPREATPPDTTACPAAAPAGFTSGHTGAPHPESLLPGVPLPEAVRQLELSSLRAALARARHNRRVAAELLGLSYDQFRGLYRRHRQDMEP